MNRPWLLSGLLATCVACAPAAQQPATVPTPAAKAPAAHDTVIHPEPKKPTLIGDQLADELDGQLQPPPASGSPAQANDEAELLRLQKSRTEADCRRAESEVRVSLQSFYGPPHGNLSAQEVAALSAAFETLRNDADFYIQIIKKRHPRPRPFRYVKGLQPCVPKEVTGAYPSGHATLARLYALVLSELFPERSAAFAKRARQIAGDRVLSGMHHPTDIATGAKLGELVYAKLSASRTYRELLSKMKADARAAGAR